MTTEHLATERFVRDLRSELLRAAEEQARHDGGASPPGGRGRVWLAAAAAAVVALVATVAVVVGGSDPASADVEVIIDGNDLVVRLTDLETRPEEIVEAAREFGLAVKVREVPVGPSNVGRFIGSASSELPPELRPEGGTETFTGFRIPKDWQGELKLDIGRPARSGEAWSAVSDALAPGEPAACEPLLGASVSEAEAVLSGRRLRTRWFVLDPGEREVLADDLDTYEDWKVVRVLAIGPRQVWVQATSDGSWPYPPALPAPVRDPDCD